MMRRRIHATAVLLVALLVVAACGVSFADVAPATTDVCGPGKGWGPVKVETPGSAKPLLDLPAIPVALVDVSDDGVPARGIDSPAAPVARVVLVEPRSPRAPPFA